ncbi:MAG: histidinol-phosphate aminotransferase family protein [Saprospiraceae bacterium]|nr:histidinol-phosphate aminotransferase family protein [Saprospiraceae bacterium]
MLFICSPNNPTGNVLTLEKIEFLIQNFDGIVVVDAAYSDFSAQNTLKWVGKYPNLVVMQTFSKAWGLAAIRLGMAFASTEIIGLMNKVKPPYNVNELTQQAALDALKNVEKMRKQVAELLQEREKLAAILRGLPVVEKVYPSDANFLFVKMTDGNAVYRYLLSRGIVTRNRSNVVLCENGVRITIGTPAENEVLIAALSDLENAI